VRKANQPLRTFSPLSLDTVYRHDSIHVVMEDIAKRISNRAKLQGFRVDLNALESKLSDLDIQRDETRKQIVQLRRVIAELASLCGERAGDDLSTTGITDACRRVISTNWMSAKDIRDEMAKRGFDFTGIENPLASLYTILNRLIGVSIEKKQEGANVFYRRKPRAPALPLARRNAFAPRRRYQATMALKQLYDSGMRGNEELK